VQAEILNLLAEIRARDSLTCLLVSHDFGVIGYMCDRLAVMDGGKIIEECDVAALALPEQRAPWTRRLLAASAGYSRALAEEMAEDWM
jgi:peptide/nickel transport system ATP-binding protein